MARTIKYADFLNPENHTVTDLNNPNCASCIECCSIATMIDEEEFSKLKKYLTKDKQGKLAYQVANKKYQKSLQGRDISLICPFATKNKRCSIYSHRPSLCEMFHCSSKLNKLSDEYKDQLERSNHKVIADLFK